MVSLRVIVGFLALWSLFLAGGCQQEAPSATTGSATSGESAAGGSDQDVVKDPEPSESRSPITPSAKLNHPGFQYSGIGYGKTLTYTFTRGEAEPVDGTQTLTVLKNTEDLIEVKRSRTGGLTDLGEDTVQVTDKGVVVIAQSMGKMDEPAVELPGDVKPGSKWTESVSFDREGQPIKQSATYTVLPEAKVTVPAGSFTALPVELKGTLTMNGTTTKMSAKAWYVKDLGMVKMEMTTEGTTKETASIVLKSK